MRAARAQRGGSGIPIDGKSRERSRTGSRGGAAR